MPSVERALGGSRAAGSDRAEPGTPAEGFSHTPRHTRTAALGSCCCVCNNRAVRDHSENQSCVGCNWTAHMHTHQGGRCERITSGASPFPIRLSRPPVWLLDEELFFRPRGLIKAPRAITASSCQEIDSMPHQS